MGKKTVWCRIKDKVCFILTYIFVTKIKQNKHRILVWWIGIFPWSSVSTMCVCAHSYSRQAYVACVPRPSTAVSKTMAVENLG